MFVPDVLLLIAEYALKFACVTLLVLYMTLAFAVGLFFVLEHLGYDMSCALRESVCLGEYLKPSEWARAAYRCLRNDPICEDWVDNLEPHNSCEGYAIRDTSDAPSEQNAAPRKLTKSERRAAGKERERVQEAERREAERRRIQQDRELKRERRRRGEEAAAAKRAAEIDAAAAQRDAEYDRVYDRWERNAQKREARDIKALFHASPPLSPQVTYYGSYTYDDSDYAYSKLLSSKRPSRSDKADAEDRLQTQRNQEEAEARRRVREQRELEKAAQMAPAYSESGPSHKPGAPKWVDEPLDDADKAKREAEKAASLARRREQARRAVEKKEQHEKRLSARAKSYKTGELILQGDRGGSGASTTARSSLQPVREDELTGTLEDFVPIDDPCFHVDDDAVSVATTAVPLAVTQHAAQRMDERGIAPHDVKKALKHGHVVPSTTVEGVYRHEGPEGGPCVVTNADGRVLTAYPARCGG